MADTRIEWTDKVWNPTTGCDRVSPGCDNCYALTLAKRLKAMEAKRIELGNLDPVGAKYQNDGDPKASGPGFLAVEHPDALIAPLSWQTPRRVFVNSMSDLFHDRITREFIAQVFAVMAATPQHTYQVLTKRHGRMRSILNDPGFENLVVKHWDVLREQHGHRVAEKPGPDWYPLPNVWLGVSVENQKWADIRIPALLDSPAAVRFLSCEPLLGPVDLSCGNVRPAFHGDCDGFCDGALLRGIDWVIVGGESGHKARPMHPDWARTLQRQCQQAGVPFFFKQWGDWAPVGPDAGAGHSIFEYVTDDDRCQILDRSGRLCGRPWPGWKVQDGTRDAVAVRRFGKHAAGRDLDGRTHDEFPAVTL